MTGKFRKSWSRETTKHEQRDDSIPPPPSSRIRHDRSKSHQPRDETRLPLSSSFYESVALSNVTGMKKAGVTARSRGARNVHLLRPRWTDRRDDGYSNHDMHCRDRATPCYGPHTCTPDHFGYTTIISTHMHARLTARKQACMHAQRDARSTSSSMRLKEVPRAAPCIHNSTGRHSPTTVPPIRSLSYTLSHLTSNPHRSAVHLTCSLTNPYNPPPSGTLMSFEDVMCRHLSLPFLPLFHILSYKKQYY